MPRLVQVSPDIRSLIEALDEPALLVKQAQVAAANASARALFGPQVEGRDIRLAIRHPQALDRVLAGRRGEEEFSGLPGDSRPWLLSVRPLAGATLLVRLSDRSGAIAAEKMRVDFVANASHELRTPLATIVGYAETLLDEGSDEPARDGFIRTILGEAKRMLRIVEDLMSLSRIEADRFVAPTEEVDLGELARIAADYARRSAEEKGIAVELTVESGLPRVTGDFAQLRQVADNLVSNAIRYGCTGDSCTVRIAARRLGAEVEFSVSDDGQGIPRDHVARVTERFYRVDAARSRESGGTGLGLAIVKHIVERHRGRLDIRSTPGLGTTVAVRLPLS